MTKYDYNDVDVDDDDDTTHHR